MVSARVPLATYPQLSSHIDVPFRIDMSSTGSSNALDILGLAHPWGTAVDTADFTRFALGPLLETALVDVIATSRFAPDDFVSVSCFEFHNADRAVAFDWFASGTGILSLRCFVRREGLRSGRSFCEDSSKLRREKRQLVRQRLLDFEDVYKNLSRISKAFRQCGKWEGGMAD